MAGGTLYTYPENFRAYKGLIAAQYSGAKVKVASQEPDFKFGETNKSEEFLKKFPLGKVPAFAGDNGVNLFESNAIAYYLATDALRGHGPTDAAYVQQWINFADNEILPAACTWVFPCMGIMQFNKQATEHAKDEIKAALALLNLHLESRTFLVGERISLADISVACNLLLLYQWVLEPEFRTAYQNTNRWFTTLVNQPEFKKVIGNFKFCEKMAQFDAKKFQELQGQKGGAQKSGGKKDKKQEQKPKQKEQPKEEETEEPKPKPAKDPFAALPAGKFVMDDWKKCYSNNDTESVAIPYFWEHFEKEFYSIWFCEYMYPQDLAMLFMSSNLITGMFQRLDKLRKHGFGSMLLFGEDYKSTISGVWFWKGQDLAFEKSEDLQIDSPSYSWKKLDPDSDETKKLVKEYFSMEGDFGGKSCYEGKIFK